MDLLRTFETESSKVEMIPIFFHSRGYKLEAKKPESYTFRRGGTWGGLYSMDARKWSTRAEVSLKKIGADKVRVNVSYHIETGAILTPFRRKKIEAEMGALERFAGTRVSVASRSKLI